ncbi:MAG: AtpZ/AtpI family protein [Crocinitomicaceae bacterium]
MSDEKKGGNLPRFARLSGVGLQMGVTIFLGAYLGKYLDEKFPSEKKWFTIIFTLIFVAIALYNVLKQVNRINQEDEDN